MPQFKNIDGRRYFKSLASVTKSKATKIAKQKRKKGILARASPDPDHRGYFGVYTAKKRKK